jgi:hypothetical protein
MIAENAYQEVAETLPEIICYIKENQKYDFLPPCSWRPANCARLQVMWTRGMQSVVVLVRRGGGEKKEFRARACARGGVLTG